MLRRKFFKRKRRKKPKKKEKKKALFLGGGALCQGFLQKILANIFYDKSFLQKPAGLDLYTI